MNSGSVDLVATDPPFNKGRDFHAAPDGLGNTPGFEDRWSFEDVHTSWLDSIKDDWPEAMLVINAARASYGDDMGAFLCFIGVRLMECHRILRDDGSIFLHCDDTASHYLKALMDAIFGRANYRNEIIWRRTSGRSDANRFGRVHDVILFYSKSERWTWNRPHMANRDEYVTQSYSYEDKRGRYSVGDLTATGRSNGESGQSWRGINPSEIGKNGRHWNTPIKGEMCNFIVANNLIPGWPQAYESVHERLEALDRAGLIHWPPKGKMPRLKRYLETTKGRAVDDIISDIGPLQANDRETQPYPTQKPLALYRRFIAAASNPGDLVLDPFVGCATTPIAAEQLGRRWVGIDIWDGAYSTVLRRLRDEHLKTEQFDHMDEEQVTLVARASVQYSNTPPARTDDTGEAAPRLKLKTQRPTEPWHRLTHSQMRSILAEAQSIGELVICAACGRSLELDFMELDHITPKSDRGVNWITNRILLCGPCNRRKSNSLTFSGLIQLNKTEEWTQDSSKAESAKTKAEFRAEEIASGAEIDL